MTTLLVLSGLLVVLLSGLAAGLALVGWFVTTVIAVTAFYFGVVGLRQALNVLSQWLPLVFRWLGACLRYAVMLLFSPLLGAFHELYITVKRRGRGAFVDWNAVGVSLSSAFAATFVFWGLVISSLVLVWDLAYDLLQHPP